MKTSNLYYNLCMKINKPIILASGSPRRLEIMHKHGLEPLVKPASVRETIPEYKSIEEVPMYLALIKGLNVLEETDLKEGIIISADTIVYLGDLKGPGTIMGKPADFQEAWSMLTILRSASHYVITGICLIDIASGIKRVSNEITQVWFKDFSDEELTAYLNTDEAYDKAGAYAIQGTFGKYVSHFDGSYDNVVGFPWEKIEKELLLL